MKKRDRVDSFRKQMAASMSELQGIMDKGQSPDGNGRLALRKVDVVKPSTYDARRVQKTRRALKVSQSVFAEIVGVSHVLVRSWERGARAPSALARRLMDEIRANPSRFVRLVRLDGFDVNASRSNRGRDKAA